jgi:hypothetical protein
MLHNAFEIMVEIVTIVALITVIVGLCYIFSF